MGTGEMAQQVAYNHLQFQFQEIGHIIFMTFGLQAYLW